MQENHDKKRQFKMSVPRILENSIVYWEGALHCPLGMGPSRVIWKAINKFLAAKLKIFMYHCQCQKNRIQLEFTNDKKDT